MTDHGPRSGRLRDSACAGPALALMIVLAMLLPTSAIVQKYPDRPLRVVNSFPVDGARELLAVLDLAATPEPVYHLSAGMRWSAEGWYRRLQERFPAFSYRLTAERDECTVGRNNAAPRSPMSIERIRRDAGYEPAYL